MAIRHNKRMLLAMFIVFKYLFKGLNETNKFFETLLDPFINFFIIFFLSSWLNSDIDFLLALCLYVIIIIFDTILWE